MGLILPLLSRIPIWLYAIVAVLVWGGYGHWKADQCVKQQKEATAEAVRLLNRSETTKLINARNVDQAYAQKLRKISSDTQSLRAANDRLQSLLANQSNTTNNTTAGCDTDDERRKTIERLLGEGADLAREGAERVRVLGAKTAALQDYIRGVCLSK